MLDDQIREIVDQLHFKRRRQILTPISIYDCLPRGTLITGTFPKQKLVLDLEAFMSASKLEEELNYASVKHQRMREIFRQPNLKRHLDHCTFWWLANMRFHVRALFGELRPIM